MKKKCNAYMFFLMDNICNIFNKTYKKELLM